MRSLSFIACICSLLVACSGTDFKGIDAATDSPSGSDGSSMEGGSDSSASDSATDSGRMDGGPGMCPTCNDGFICCMAMSSVNYMKCTAKNCLACCM